MVDVPDNIAPQDLLTPETRIRLSEMRPDGDDGAAIFRFEIVQVGQTIGHLSYRVHPTGSLDGMLKEAYQAVNDTLRHLLHWNELARKQMESRLGQASPTQTS